MVIEIEEQLNTSYRQRFSLATACYEGEALSLYSHSGLLNVLLNIPGQQRHEHEPADHLNIPGPERHQDEPSQCTWTSDQRHQVEHEQAVPSLPLTNHRASTELYHILKHCIKYIILVYSTLNVYLKTGHSGNFKCEGEPREQTTTKRKQPPFPFPANEQ